MPKACGSVSPWKPQDSDILSLLYHCGHQGVRERVLRKPINPSQSDMDGNTLEL